MDGDTGYGNAVNVHYAVQEFIHAGVASVQFEDQEAPKKSGTLAGRRCIPIDEAVGKYRAAVAARDALDPSFVICARCDVLGAEGGSFEENIENNPMSRYLAGVSVQQDLALVSLLGLTHVERNAHHFIDGMSVAPDGEQAAFLKAHPRLYHRGPGEPVRLTVQDGKLDLGSLGCPGFAVGAEMDFQSLKRMKDAPKEKIQ